MLSWPSIDSSESAVRSCVSTYIGIIHTKLTVRRLTKKRRYRAQTSPEPGTLLTALLSVSCSTCSCIPCIRYVTDRFNICRMAQKTMTHQHITIPTPKQPQCFLCTCFTRKPPPGRFCDCVFVEASNDEQVGSSFDARQLYSTRKLPKRILLEPAGLDV